MISNKKSSLQEVGQSKVAAPGLYGFRPYAGGKLFHMEHCVKKPCIYRPSGGYLRKKSQWNNRMFPAQAGIGIIRIVPPERLSERAAFICWTQVFQA